MHDQQLSQIMKKAIDQRLSALEGDPWLARRIINAEKGDTPIVKKKISVSLIFVLIFTILTLGAAAALVHSQIADRLYGPESPAPQEVLDQIQTPNKSAQTELARIALTELYFDGSDLHTVLSIENLTQDPLLFTLDGCFINGMHAHGNHLFSEGPGSMGVMLGGTVEGTALPALSNQYERWQQVAKTNEDGKFISFESIPQGKVSLRFLVDVWRPLNDPKLVNYRDFEGENITASLHHLITDEKGNCNLELFRPESARRSYSSQQSGGEIYAPVFKKLGWAERVNTIEMTLEVDLDQILVSQAVPEKSEYFMNGFRIAFDSFQLTHAGGTLKGRIYGNQQEITAFLQKGLILADLKTRQDLSRGCIWSNEVNPDQSISFEILLSPIAGDLPETVYLIPPIAYNDQFVEEYPHFDPALEKPENIIGTWEVDFNQMLEIKLHRK